MEHTGAELGHMFSIGDEEESSGDEEEGEDEEDEEEEMDEEEDNSDEADEEIESDNGEMLTGEASANDDNIVKVGETDSSYSKGLAVVSQLATWDKLLEQRILMQKMLTKVNTFPQFMEPEDNEHMDLVRQASKSLMKLAQKSVQLKNCMESKGVEEYEVVGPDMEEMEKWLEDTAKAAEKG